MIPAWRLAALVLAAGAGAPAPARPMAVFEPYVGTWSCLEVYEGAPAHTSVFRFEFEAQLLRETIFAPKSPAKPDGDVVVATFAFDARTGRYVEVEMGGDAHWWASTAAPPTAGAFHWLDAGSSETPSRWEMTLPVDDAFAIVGYARPRDATPSYRASCERRQE